MTQHEMTHERMSATDGAMQACIAMCTECHATCLKTAMRCLDMGGPHAAPHHIGLLLDCADICRTSADFMLRGSSMHAVTCGACAEICAACAEECGRFTEDFMQACAATCRRCAESCRQMAAQGSHAGH